MLAKPFESTIKELCEEILSEQNPQALSDRIMTHIKSTFPVEAATLWLTEQDATGVKRLRLAAATGRALPLMSAQDGRPAVYDFGEGLTGHIAQQRTAVNVRNWQEFSQYPHAQKYDHVTYEEGRAQEFCRCVLGVPLWLKSTSESPPDDWRPIGVLKLENIRSGEAHPEEYFTDNDVSIVAAYGAVVAVALEKARMRADSIRIGQGLLEISRRLLAGLGERPNLADIVHQTADVISAEACGLWLRSGTHLFVEAAWGYQNATAAKPYNLEITGTGADRFKGVGLTVLVGNTQQPLNLQTAEAVRGHPAWKGANDGSMWGKPHGQACYSLVAIPLVDDETKDLKGVFKIENKKPTIFQVESYFNLEDQKLLETLGNSICLSLIVSERIDRLHRLENLLGNIRVLDGLDRALYFILTGLTHNDGLQYNRALVFLKEPPDPNVLVCKFAVGHVTAAGWETDMKKQPDSGKFDLATLIENLDQNSPVYQTDIWEEWCTTYRGVSLDDVAHQKIASHINSRAEVQKYLSADVQKYLSGDLNPEDVLHGFAHGDFVLIPIYIENDLRGVIYADNRFTGNRINQFECHVLELFAGFAGAIIQAAEVPGKLQHALRASAGTVAHSLRNSLTVISSEASHLVEQQLPDEAADAARVVSDETKDAERIVRAFLEFAKAAQFERNDFRAPADLIAELTSVVTTKSHVQVVAEGTASGPTVRTDMGRLKDDFLAFANDSKRHKPTDDLVASIGVQAATDIEVQRLGLLAGHRYLKLTYSDNGPGIQQSLKERIFEPFYTGTTGGTGLGLTMAAHNAKVHGGCIVETGHEGQGVRFEIYLRGEA